MTAEEDMKKRLMNKENVVLEVTCEDSTSCINMQHSSKKEVMAIKLKQGTQGDVPLPDVSRHGFSDQDVLEMEIKEFIENIRHRRKPTVSGREGRRALAVALSVISQIQENQEHFGHLMGDAGNFGFVDHP